MTGGAHRKFTVDIEKDGVVVQVVERDDNMSSQCYLLLPISRPHGNNLGVVIALDLIQDVFHYLHTHHTNISPESCVIDWESRHMLDVEISKRRDLESRVLWPVIETSRFETIGAELYLDQTKLWQLSSTQVSLCQLRESLHFDDGQHTTIMQYPEIVALIDGADFHYPDPRFINDMYALEVDASLDRDPDWFRSVEDLPRQWQGKCCELCGSTKNIVRHIIGPSRIVRCASCGLEYDNPQAIINSRSLDKYSSTSDPKRNGTPSRHRAEQNAATFIADLQSIAPSLLGQPLLEIGCASGEFLWALREKYGWPNEHLLGIEPSELSSHVAQTNYGLKILDTWAEEADLEKRKFSIVVMLNTIEHLSRPRQVLELLRAHVSAHGVLFIGTVPNVTSLAATVFPEGFIAKNFPDGQHHYQYSPTTLIQLCKKMGFETIRLEGRRRDIVGAAIKETALWLAYTCGVPLDTCQDPQAMLRELKKHLEQANEQMTMIGDAQSFAINGSDFTGLDALISFWKREIWSSPYLSDTFDVWLRPSERPNVSVA